jgi:hypothetical protein
MSRSPFIALRILPFFLKWLFFLKEMSKTSWEPVILTSWFWHKHSTCINDNHWRVWFLAFIRNVTNNSHSNPIFFDILFLIEWQGSLPKNIDGCSQWFRYILAEERDRKWHSLKLGHLPFCDNDVTQLTLTMEFFRLHLTRCLYKFLANFQGPLTQKKKFRAEEQHEKVIDTYAMYVVNLRLLVS